MKDSATNKMVKIKTDNLHCDSTSKEVNFQNRFDGGSILHESHQQILSEHDSAKRVDMSVDSEERLNTRIGCSSDEIEVFKHKSSHKFEENLVQISANSKVEQQNPHFEETKLQKQDKLGINVKETSQENSLTSSKDAIHQSVEKNSTCCYNGVQFCDQNQMHFEKPLPQFLQNGIESIQLNKNFSSIAKIGHQDSNQKCLIGEFKCESQTIHSQKSFKSENCDIESKNKVKKESLMALPSTHNLSQNEKMDDVEDDYSEVQLNKALSHLSSSYLANSSQLLPQVTNDAQELESILQSFQSEIRKLERPSSENLANDSGLTNNQNKQDIKETQNRGCIDHINQPNDIVFESNQRNNQNKVDQIDLQSEEIPNDSNQVLNLQEKDKNTMGDFGVGKLKDAKMKKQEASHSKIIKNDSKKKNIGDKKTTGSNSTNNLRKDLKDNDKNLHDSQKDVHKSVTKNDKNTDFQDSAEKTKNQK
jgi:hypothetical protein